MYLKRMKVLLLLLWLCIGASLFANPNMKGNLNLFQLLGRLNSIEIFHNKNWHRMVLPGAVFVVEGYPDAPYSGIYKGAKGIEKYCWELFWNLKIQEMTITSVVTYKTGEDREKVVITYTMQAIVKDTKGVFRLPFKLVVDRIPSTDNIVGMRLTYDEDTYLRAFKGKGYFSACFSS